MRPVYRASFDVGTESKTPCLDDVIKTIEAWTSPKLPTALEDLSQGTQWTDGSLNLTTLRGEHDGMDYFGLEMNQPETDRPSMIWRTQIALTQKHDKSPVFDLLLSHGKKDLSITPHQRITTAPRVVASVIEEHGGSAFYPLSTRPNTLSTKEVAEFTEVMMDDLRQIPLVFVSATNFFDKPILSAEKLDALARQLSGIAQVYTGKDRWTSFKLEDHIGKTLSCYDGAVRIYWPMSGDDDIYHPLRLPNAVRRTRHVINRHLLETISSFSISRVPEHDYESLARLQRRAQIDQAQNEQDYQVLAELYLQENESLKQEADQYKYREAQLQRKISELESRISSFEADKEEERPAPASVRQAVEQIEEIYDTDTLEILSRAQRGAKKSPYKKPEQIFDALEWLATTYRKSKSGETTMDLAKSAKKLHGLDYKPHQSEITMGKYEDEYTVMYDGKNEKLHEHIGRGSSKDPRHSFRIAWFWNERKKRAVVGYIGQHQTNDNT